MPLIPTKFRAASSKKVKCPLGAEIISSALEGVPQYNQLSLSFYAGFSSNIDQQLKEQISKGQALKVLSVTYSNRPQSLNSSNDLIIAGYYDQNWEILIEGVPAKYSNAIKELLIVKALPQIRQWLCEHNNDDLSKGGKALDFFVSFPRLELISKERKWY